MDKYTIEKERFIKETKSKNKFYIEYCLILEFLRIHFNNAYEHYQEWSSDSLTY